MTQNYLTKKLMVSEYRPTGNASNQACASVQLLDTNKGMLINQLTTTQRNAIVDPVAPLLIYNTTTEQYEFYNGSIWVPLVGDSPDVQNNINQLRNLNCLVDGSTPTIANQIVFNNANQAIATIINISTTINNPNSMNCGNALLNMAPTETSNGGLLLIGSAADLTKTCIFQVTQAIYETTYIHLTVQFIAQYGSDFTTNEPLNVFLTPGSLTIDSELTAGLQVASQTVELKTGYSLGTETSVILDSYGRIHGSNTGTTVAPNVAAGTGPTITLMGNDVAGFIQLTVGALPEFNQPLFTVTFHNPYATAPSAVILMPASANALAAFSAGNGPIVETSTISSSVTTTGWTATQIGATLTQGSQYVWWYYVIG